MRPFLAACALVAGLTANPAAAQQRTQPTPTNAQALVDGFVRTHAGLAALELAVTGERGCRTVAATAREDVGERCDEDELGPIRTGRPDIEEPTAADPVYDITQALHDADGRLIGAAGMDLRPDSASTRESMLAQAQELLRELERQIPSKAWLLQRREP